MEANKEQIAFQELLDILDRLRNECPWDKEQTNLSLRNLTIEEVYELADALIEDDDEEIKKELGDVLLHIVFYAKIAKEKEKFDIVDVINKLNTKLIYRHPHIFSNTEASNSKEVEENWERLKLKEKGGNKTVLSGVPKSLSALIKSKRIQDKVSSVGFDWENKAQVWEKVEEEKAELLHEINIDENNNNFDKIEDEFGDLFFSLVNAARLYNIDPETALERTNKKFIKRFNYLENKTIAQGKDLKEMSLDEMNRIWEESKKQD